MAQAKMTDYARFDHALLISLSNGLGTWLRTGDVDSEGREVKGTFYQKDQDCLAFDGAVTGPMGGLIQGAGAAVSRCSCRSNLSDSSLRTVPGHPLFALTVCTHYLHSPLPSLNLALHIAHGQSTHQAA
eukprot:246079-Pelagomonas_calceolata.AAC.1